MNLFVTWGVRHVPQTLSLHPWMLVHVLVDPTSGVGSSAVAEGEATNMDEDLIGGICTRRDED